MSEAMEISTGRAVPAGGDDFGGRTVLAGGEDFSGRTVLVSVMILLRRSFPRR
ncbi:MAG: hypothetical protein NC400_06585 [Clostridium sp.]|nr:hypothetical protein [Clostridium sp.]